MDVGFHSVVELEVRNDRCGGGDVLLVEDGDGAQDVAGLAAVERHHHFHRHCSHHSHNRVRGGSADVGGDRGDHGEGNDDDELVACDDVSCCDRRNKVPQCGESPV